ncbi:MAG: putative lipid II flippase FtsW [Limnobacter sp.]|nr:putative lipid II flippase FtsW [Limnobacter sp.]
MLKPFRRRHDNHRIPQNLIPASVGGGYTGAHEVREQVAGDTIDQWLVWSSLSLLFIGLIMVYSATVALPDSSKYASYSQTHFLYRHAFSMAMGGVVALALFQVPVKMWQQTAPILFTVGIAMLALVLVPGIGREVNGARRWLPLVLINVQPSEFMKVFAVLYAADYAVRKQAFMQRFGKIILPMLVAMFLVGTLLLLEPDMGAFIVIVAIVFGILFLGGINAKVFFSLSGGLCMAFAAMILFSDYRRARFLAYLDPWSGDNALNKAYQLSHSLIAFGRGELFGVGLGGSLEKLHYLPEAHTDFLLAVIGEELGFVGVAVVILLFVVLVQRCFLIGQQAMVLERIFAGLVAKGVGVWIAVQSFVNMGVNVGLLPTKGLTLPLMSYGGSGILANCIALALVLRVGYENRVLMRGGGV